MKSTRIIFNINIRLKEMFEDMSDLNYFFLQLQLHYHVELENRNSVIIFDEVSTLDITTKKSFHNFSNLFDACKYIRCDEFLDENFEKLFQF